MRAEVEELKARARTITKADIYAIVGAHPTKIEVTEACMKVCIQIHMGEAIGYNAGQYTYPLLKLVESVLKTDLLDLSQETFSEGCDTCEYGLDRGWEIWARYKGYPHA